MIARFAFAALVAMMLSGCAGLRAMHANQDCNYGRDPSWRRVEAPADAERYRQLARAHPSEEREPVLPREVWFERADGSVKYCVIDARPLLCDTQSGTWWDFDQTEEGPRTSGANYGICLT
ncbi:MAG: hypothetical protein DCF16_15955 [Alphaproteobacteria bacterium]|nr:MAG: hypothetical protein DCF16_15955 [Alphaproteobacteria bacterium]